MDQSSTIDDVNPSDLDLLCVFAFDTLISKLTKEKIPSVFPESLKSKKFPLFVTWSTGPSKSLRGCIGTFKSDNLESNLKEYSLTAAFEDSRFKPIKLEEIKNLNVGISLLTNFEKAKDCYDWEIGKHGIQIKFLKYYRATFLPEVAVEHKMDKETTLRELVYKSMYNGELEDVIDKIEMTRYQSKKLFMTYNQYKEFKDKKE
jgi:uncharacterized protein (TIGR00296 family)